MASTSSVEQQKKKGVEEEEGGEPPPSSMATTVKMAKDFSLDHHLRYHLFGGLNKHGKRERGSTAKERISKMPPCAAGKRSSIYRGVTRHRWTGRYEAHLWDKSTWNENQNKKGKQVYLGAYDEEEAAARAYDLAALKYWGPGTLINFPVTDYTRDVEEMQMFSREDYLASLRRKSSGFSRGVSKYRGHPKQAQSGRWDTNVGRILGNKYLHCGSTSEEPAMENEHMGGFGGIGNKIDLTGYIKWWRPNRLHAGDSIIRTYEDSRFPSKDSIAHSESKAFEWPCQPTAPYQLPSLGISRKNMQHSPLLTACGILSESAAFKNMQERAASLTYNDRCSNEIGHENVSQKVNNVGEGDVLGLPLHRTPYPFASLRAVPLLTNCSTADPLSDSIFWPNVVPSPGLSLTATFRKCELGSPCAYYNQD